VGWAGSPRRFKIADLDLEKRYGIELATGGNILPAMVAYKNFPGMEGAPTTTSASPRTRSTKPWWPQHYKQFKSPPDFFTAGGFSAAMAIVTALKKTNGRHQHQQADPPWKA
jgi:branched-chain amino acid transport system substrate-binding protein